MMNWYAEAWTEGVKIAVKYKAHLHHEKTPFQAIDIYDSDDLGRFFTLDGLMMVTEKDEWIYHDMITHVPMAVNPAIQKVLVIGGGDGGTVRELCRYPTISHIDFVEIDQRVVELSQKYFPGLTSTLGDPRVHMRFEDGLAFVNDAQDKSYDLILVDSTDPIGPGEGLFTQAFYDDCYRILKDEGILINQHESPYFPNYLEMMKRSHKKIKGLFPISEIYHFHQPFYPSGFWCFGFASKSFHPVKDHKPQVWERFGIKTRYYNSALHTGSFALPTFVTEELKDV